MNFKDVHRYTIKLMRKYADGKSAVHKTCVISSTVNNITNDAESTAKDMRDTAIDGGFYNKDDFYALVSIKGVVVWKFDIDSGDPV